MSGSKEEEVGKLLKGPYLSKSWSVPLPLLYRVEEEAERLGVSRSVIVQAALAMYFLFKEEPVLAARIEALVKALGRLAKEGWAKAGVEPRLAEVFALAEEEKKVVSGG